MERGGFAQILNSNWSPATGSPELELERVLERDRAVPAGLLRRLAADDSERAQAALRRLADMLVRATYEALTAERDPDLETPEAQALREAAIRAFRQASDSIAADAVLDPFDSWQAAKLGPIGKMMIPVFPVIRDGEPVYARMADQLSGRRTSGAMAEVCRRARERYLQKLTSDAFHYLRTALRDRYDLSSKSENFVLAGDPGLVAERREQEWREFAEVICSDGDTRRLQDFFFRRTMHRAAARVLELQQEGELDLFSPERPELAGRLKLTYFQAHKWVRLRQADEQRAEAHLEQCARQAGF